MSSNSGLQRDADQNETSEPVIESKKKQRLIARERNRKRSELCHEFAANDACRFGESCKYSHNLREYLADYGDYFQTLSEWRLSNDAEDKVVNAANEPFAYPLPPFHKTFQSKPGDATYLMLHAHNNGILALCIPADHPAISHENTVYSMEFNRQTFYNPQDALATITIQDGQRFDIRTPLPGTVVEWNESLPLDVSLLKRDAQRTGYLCLYKPKSPFDLLLPRFFRLLAQYNEYEGGED